LAEVRKNLVDEYFLNGPPFMVKIQLEENLHTRSGLTWTSQRGPPYLIESGTMVSADIVCKTCSPIHLLMPYVT
jgi:hypothetical protein